MGRHLATLLLLLGLLAVLPSTASAAKCTPPKYPSSGEYTSLKVTHVSCADGTKVVKSFYTCRTKTGPSGRCVKKVRGYACRETRTATTQTEFVGTATCTNGKKKVVIGYRQTITPARS
jgi:hypothetical protein